MKRLQVAVILLLVIVVVASYSTWEVHTTVRTLESSLTQLRNTPQSHTQEIVDQSQALLEQWNGYEDKLVLYINHKTLDTLSLQLAQIPALAEYQEFSFLYSNIDASLELLDDLWKSTIPNYRNLL